MSTPQDPSPTTSHDSKNSCLIDAPDYIAPPLQDFLLTDINEVKLFEIGNRLGVDYLGPAEFPGGFPVDGRIHGDNSRLMINLVCRRSSRNPTQAVNIIFLVDTGSPHTYLSKKAISALIPETSPVPSAIDVFIHQNTTIIDCHMSPEDKHFADVNVLGADFMINVGLTLICDYPKKKCRLTQQSLME